jgi:hypothetical protein
LAGWAPTKSRNELPSILASRDRRSGVAPCGSFDELRRACGHAELFDVVTSDAGVLSREHGCRLDALGLDYVVALEDNRSAVKIPPPRRFRCWARAPPKKRPAVSRETAIA